MASELRCGKNNVCSFGSKAFRDGSTNTATGTSDERVLAFAASHLISSFVRGRGARGEVGQVVTEPPFNWIVCPVIQPASFDAR